MPHSSESDSDAPEAISLKMAKKSSKTHDKLVQDRNSKCVRFPFNPIGSFLKDTDICVIFCRRVAKLAKDKNRARDAWLKAAKEATNNRSFEADSSSGKNGGKMQTRTMRKSDDNRIDVEPNEEDNDPTQKRIRTRMEAAMLDAEGEGTDTGTEEPEGLSDDDAEGLDGDFAFGEDDSIAYEDVELEEISVDDEEMKDPEEEEEEYWTGIGSRPRSSGAPPASRERKEGDGRTSSNLDYLPDELFAQAAAAITARVQKTTDSKTKEVKRKKRTSRQKVKSKDLIIG
jgi:hypothetical protein